MNHVANLHVLTILLILAFACGLARADVVPGSLFTDYAVLQRDSRVPVWGTADDGDKVTVTIDGQSASTVATGGRWRVDLKPMKAGGPYTLTIAGPKNTVKLNNVSVGEVWVCSGQSNMALQISSMANAKQILSAPDDPDLHLFTVDATGSDQPRTNVSGRWTSRAIADPGFSAVGYVFGRELRRALGVPVGLIESAYSGTAAEAWTSEEALAADPEFVPGLTAYQKALADYPAKVKDYRENKLPELQRKYEAAKAQYDVDTANIKAKYDADVAAAKAAGTAAPPPPTYPAAPQPPRDMPGPSPATSPYPARLYNGMIAPLQPYAIRGALWYQGESNASHAYQYQKLLPMMIGSWRKGWDEGDFPFIIIQLPPISAISDKPTESAWAELREAQRLTALKGHNIGLAVTTDISDEPELHPLKKEPVGIRAAAIALGMAYHRKGEYMGPVFDKADPSGDHIVVRFKHADGLHADGPVTGFQIAGKDGVWHNATATISGSDVTVSDPAVPQPIAVRLGWDDHPVINLKNAAGFGAGPFRSDDTNWITMPKPPAAPATGK